PQAALLNASMAHALDFDDTLDHGGSIHPGASVLAASLAMADMLGGVSGERLLLAIALGLDVSCRVALASTVDRGWHRTAAMGVFGAAAASGKLPGLTVEQMVNARGSACRQDRLPAVESSLPALLPKASPAHRTSSSAASASSNSISQTVMMWRRC